MSYNQRNRRCLFDFDILRMHGDAFRHFITFMFYLFSFFFVCSQLIGCGRTECLMNRTHLTHEFQWWWTTTAWVAWNCQTDMYNRERPRYARASDFHWLISFNTDCIRLLRRPAFRCTYTQTTRSIGIVYVAMHFSSHIRHDTETLWLSKRN